MHIRLDVLEESGYVLLRDYRGPPIDATEYERLKYMRWKSGGETNFAPLASAFGDMECSGFWNHGKPDKDGAWTANSVAAPSLVGWVNDVGAKFGRVRVIRLNPSTEEAALLQLHRDTNNRLNPVDKGWVVRAWLELSDNPGAQMILRTDRDDPVTEIRIPLHLGRQMVIDSERLWHVVWNPGPEPRYALISSFESGGKLECWITKNTTE